MLEPEPNFDGSVAELMLQQMGYGMSFVKERRKAVRKMLSAKVVVSEIYSPPRITAELKDVKKNQHKSALYRNMVPGLALDLIVNDPDDGQPWDSCVRSKREKARELIRQTQPILLIGSSMCITFSTWQRLNRARARHPEAMRRAYFQACAHLAFVAQLYRDQLADGRYFLHEHPCFALFWRLNCMEEQQGLPTC